MRGGDVFSPASGSWSNPPIRAFAEGTADKGTARLAKILDTKIVLPIPVSQSAQKSDHKFFQRPAESSRQAAVGFSSGIAGTHSTSPSGHKVHSCSYSALDVPLFYIPFMHFQAS